MFKRLFRFFRLGIIISLIIVGATVVFYREIKSLPQLPKTKFWEPVLSSKLLDRKGEVLFEYAIEKREYLPLTVIPRHLAQAVVAIEDERFYKHWGLDLKAVVRALWANFVHGRVVQGGSTITQQLAKNLFLTREKSFRRKFREVLLALFIERNLSKNEILEMYLNQVYLGHGIYGMSEGAQNFFGKDLSQASLPEAALLAGLVRVPGRYSPWKNPDVARSRSKTVLRRMEELALISPQEFKKASKEEVVISSKTLGLPAHLAHLVEYIRQDIEERYSPELLWKGGLQIETTIDADYQKLSFDVLQKAVTKFDEARLLWETNRGHVAYSTNPLKVEAAFLMMEAKTGGILVWLGGRDFKNSQFNRVYQSKRQPGSAFKPFVWATAIEHSFTPASIFEDLPIAYNYDGRTWRLVPGSTDFIVIHQASASLPAESLWVPDNFDSKYLGTITLRRALALSRNLVSVRLVDQLSPRNVVNLAHKMGIESHLEAVPSLALGTCDVSLLELAGSYQTLANSGIHAKPYTLRAIRKTTTGETLEEHIPRLEEAINPSLAFVVTDMMKSTVKEGTAAYAGRRIRHPMAGKTGTTQDNRDLWFVGFTPEVVAGAWMGYDSFEPLGKRDVTGGSTVVPWWTEIMQVVLKNYSVRDFGPPPEGVVFQKICALSGKLAKGACPKARLEVFLKETAPQSFCDLATHEQALPLRRKDIEPMIEDEETEQ